jgi:hypothetical protein
MINRVINIRLKKEGKEKFWFGEITAAVVMEMTRPGHQVQPKVLTHSPGFFLSMFY